MISLKKSDANLDQFSRVMRNAYRQGKSQGLIPKDKISVYDKLLASPAMSQQNGWVQPSEANHRRWRNKAARMYRRKHGGRLGSRIGGFFDDIDWEYIMTWIMENLIPLLEMFFMMLPFLI